MVFNAKIKLLGILLLFLSLFAVSSPTFGMESTENYDGYAKVVFLGNFRAGKTVLYNLLCHFPKKLDDTKHTKQISFTNMKYDIDGRKIAVYFSDTSAEPCHKQVMDEFCHNAHIIFVVVNAKDLIEGMNGVGVTSSQKYFENLLCSIPDLSPNCRIIVVLTQKDNINKNLVTNAFFVKKRISQYIKDLDELFSDSGILVDSKYELTLKDTTGEEAINHRKTLEDLIIDSLKKYGIDKLPKTADGFKAEVVEKSEEIVDKTHCIGKDETHTEYSYSLKVLK